MAKFVLLYHGGNKQVKDFDMDAMMTAWHAWVAEMGDNLVDAGSGVGMSKTVFADGKVEDNGGSNPMSGYCVVEAEDMEQAVAICKAHPYLMSGGNIEVAQGWQGP